MSDAENARLRAEIQELRERVRRLEAKAYCIRPDGSPILWKTRHRKLVDDIHRLGLDSLLLDPVARAAHHDGDLEGFVGNRQTPKSVRRYTAHLDGKGSPK